MIATRKYGISADIYSLAVTIWEIFHRECFILFIQPILCFRKPYSELGQNHFVILQKVRKGARPKITSKEMKRELSRFISRYPVFIFLLTKRPCIFVKHDSFRCWHEDASKRPAIKEIIEYFVSKLNGLNYDQQMMMPSSSEETSPTHKIISEPVRLKAQDLKGLSGTFFIR